MTDRPLTILGVRLRLLRLGLLIVACLVAPGVEAAITLVQHANKDAGTVTSSTLAFPSANATGNWIGVVVRAGQAGQNVSVSDTRGNTYRRAAQVNLTLDPVTLAVYYAESVAGGANTVTVSDTLTGGTLRFAIFEYSGVAAASSIDGTPVFAEGTSAAAASPPLTTSTSGDLVIGAISVADGSTYTAGSGYTMQERVPASGTKLGVEDQFQAAAGAITATASFSSIQKWASLVAAFHPSSGGPPPPADLTLAKSHAGSFVRGQTGATYALTAANAGTGPTVGTVTVTDTLPSGLTATALAGTGWSCTLATVSCTRADALAAGASYPAITLTVNVSAAAPASVTNTATVSGGGETNTANDGANDPTTINAAAAADLTLAKSHSGSFTQGQTGATYSLTATNSGTGATSGTVTVTDTLPTGLTATGFAGTGWSCTVSPLSCTRGDALAAGASYPAITLTVNVSASASSPVTNTATVSGGGETNTANNGAGDATTIVPPGSGTVAIVQHAQKDAGTVTSSTLAFPAANTAGNFIAVVIRAGNPGQTITVTDTRGNTYRRAAQFNLALDPVTLGIYYAESIAAGANTVTVSDTISGGTLRFAIFEYSGVATSGSLDGTPVFAEGNGASLASPAVITTAAGDLILGALITADGTTISPGAGFTMQERVPASGTKLGVEDQRQAAAGPITATGTISSGQAWAAAVAAFRAGSGGPPPPPDLTLAKSHAGSFIQGQTGATYTLTAANGGGSATTGAVTVTDTLPSGLTATGFSGTGWSCTVSPLSCTRSDALAAGASYPAITLTVDVSASASSPLTNTASVSGGGETNTANDAASDVTTVLVPGLSDLTLAKTHSGSFTQGQTGATYALTVTNGGTGATSGTVTVTDTLPLGLTATAIAGTGWSCTLGTLTCTRADALAAGASYPAITLTVNVSASAPSSVTNTASVSGGGETNTANDGASDPTTISGSGAASVGQWSAVQNWPVVAVHAHLLPTGKVLAWTDYTINNGATVWTPGTSSFTPKNYSTTSLFCAGHSYLGDGRLLIAGGIVGLADDTGPRESTIFDPATETFSAGPLMAQGRYYPTTTTLGDGRVLVQGGTTTCTTCIADQPEIYDPATNVWTPMAASAQKAFKYYPHTYVLPDGRVLAAAQDDSAVVTQVLDLTTQQWTVIDSRIIDGHSSVMYVPGKIMKAGKATADDQGHPSVATTYVLDMTQPSPSWQATQSMAFPRSYLNLTVLPDGKVLATGGSTTTDKANYSAAVYAAELWDPATQTWSTMSSAVSPRLYHSTALLLPDATVLVAGGGRQNGRSQPDPKDQQNAEIYSPPYLFRGARPAISSAPATLTYGTAFTVTTPDAAQIAKVSLIALSSVTHAFNENQRFVPLSFTAGAGSLTVQPPANGNIAPPGPYMLFLVNSNGVPSVASMVRLPAAAAPPLRADMTLAKSHTGSFTRGQVGATYTLTASNSGTAATTGSVTVTDTLPSDLTATGFAGTGWSCTLSPLSCTRSNALAAGASYPAITLTVNVSAAASASVTNTASVSGGGETNTANDGASDLTTIAAAPVSDLTLAKTHAGSFTQGQTGATYSLVAANGGTAPTSGTVTVSDTLPSGLTATALAGTGWSCTLATLTCTRADALSAGASYPAITLTVNVAAGAPASVTNTATVSGGGETNTANDGASDPTTIAPPGGATIAIVQHAQRDAGTGTTATLAFPAGNTAGNFIAVVVRAGKTGQVFTVTDTRGNTYRRAAQLDLSLDPVTMGVYYAENVAAGSNTVTVSDTVNGGTLRFAIFEYSGVAQSSSLDGTPLLGEGSSVTVASPSLATSVNGDLILGAISTSNGVTYTAGSGFTVQERVPASGTKLGVEDRRQTAAGAVSATATLSASTEWAAIVAAFKPAGATPPNGPKLIINVPAEGGTNSGSTVPVSYSWTGDLTEVNHVHFQLDANPVVMDLSFEGVYSFSGVHVGAHTLNGVLVRADHSSIAGSDATPVHFTVAVDPADPVLPNVSVTAPSGGSTISGTVTVTASASDNVGVYGVQFLLDGVVLGAEDLVAPYSVDWNTTTAGNGGHTLSAIARDAAGNERTSATVAMTVSNVASNDPSVIGQWAGPYNWPLVTVHSMLMPNGKVLLYDDHTNSAGVQVWDPVTDNLTSRPYNANNLFCSGHTMLPDGRVFVVGGHLGTYLGIPDSTIFNPVNENWSAGPTMSQARWYPTATSLPDGRVLAMSGASDCSSCNDPNGSHTGIALVPEVYDPRLNTWTRLDNASLSLPLYPHMHVIPDGRVLAVSSSEDPIVTRALDVTTQTWSVVDSVVRDGGSSVQYRPGKILKTGLARNVDYAPVPSTATAYVMDTTQPSPSWRAVAPMSFPRTQHNLTVLPDGQVLAVGGSTNSNVYDTAGTVKTAELWNPTTETWRNLAVMQEPRHYHSTSLLLPDGRVLMSGGGRFGPDFPSAEIFSPPYLFKGPRPTISSVPSTIQYNSHITVTTPNSASIAKVTLLRLGSPTHAFDENQRYVELPFTAIAGGLDVTVPSGQNIIIPGHYTLFLVDGNGVPSVGSIVRFPAPWEDTVPPTAPSGLGASATPGRVSLAWTAATDNTGVALYNVHRGTLPGFTPNAGNRIGQTAATSYADTGFASGTYYYVVTAQDAGGTVGPPSNEAPVVAQADTTNPAASITAPGTGASLSGLVTVTANASDDVGVSGVQFLLDGASLGPEDLTAPYAYDWNTGLAQNGAHTVSARARDARGNTGTAANVGVTVANTTIQGMMAAYSFDEGTGTTVTDSSINANNGVTHGTTWTTSGHSLGGLAFTPNNYFDVANSAALDVAGHGLTIEMWANITAGGSVDYVLIDKPWAATGQPFPYYQYGIEYDANGARTLDFMFGNTAGQVVGPFSMLPQTGVWTHIAFTYDGTSVKGYLDGILKVTGSATTDIQARGFPLRVGVDGQLQQGFSGKLDDLRIYNRALTQTEIQQDMARPVALP